MMARAFDSTPKKLAIPLFGLFFVGWIVFTAGFGLLLSNKEEDTTLKQDPNRSSPLYFPHYTTLVGGIFVALLGLLHAALPSGTPSSIIGALSTVLNTIYFVSVGFVINVSYGGLLEIRGEQRWDSYPDDHDPQLVRAVRLMLAGSIMLTVSWGLVQLLSQFFYEHCPQHVQTRTLWCVIVECWNNRTTVVGDVSESVRISSIPAMLLSAVGWGVFVGGFHNVDWGYNFGDWSAIFIPSLMYLTSLLHVGYTGKASTLMGIFASILNTFFVVGMGFAVTVTAIHLYRILHQFRDEYSDNSDVLVHSDRLMLGGGVVCLVFWTVVLVMWPFYRPKGTSHSHAANNEIINSDSYDGPLLPVSPSVAIHPETDTHHSTSQEYAQQPHMEEYRTPDREGEAGNV